MAKNEAVNEDNKEKNIITGKLIKSLNEIDFPAGELVEFEATVLSKIYEGSEGNKPWVFSVKLEESGEVVDVKFWDSKFIPSIEEAISNSNIFLFKAIASIYRDKEQLNVKYIKDTYKESDLKQFPKMLDYKEEIGKIVKKYIKNKFYKSVIDNLIMNNEDFFQLPAATSVHHNYPGGLAKHSFSVCRNAINIMDSYKSEYALNKELIVAGALLHDIGKLKEYNLDGSRTLLGDLEYHLYMGAEMIHDQAVAQGLDDTDMDVLKLKHVILAHHGKLEYQAVVQPRMIEAEIVYLSDDLDAKMESMINSLININDGASTGRLLALDGGSLYKL